jgi:hypothetical protein
MDELLNIWDDAIARGMAPEAYLLVVDVASQSLSVVRDGMAASRIPVSTAKSGLGGQEGSNRTPGGFHQVADRIGEGAQAGSVFESRRPTSDRLEESAWRAGDGDRILSRILRLRGLEPGRNAGPGVDSYDRYIYIHGTNQEGQLGAPSSAGCIRMGNHDIIRLARILADQPAWCWIGTLP